MKKILLYLLLLLPSLAFGQLFPDLPEIQGQVKMIVEKQMGKEIRKKKSTVSVWREKAPSGWKTIYLFDENSNLLKRTNTFRNKVTSSFSYKRDTANNRTTIRETPDGGSTGNSGGYIEYENFTDEKGQRIKTNFWTYNSTLKKWEIYQSEQNAVYQNGRLTSFTRYQVNDTGDFSGGEKFNIRYNGSGKIDHIERVDLSSGFRSEMTYIYNAAGSIEKSSIDFLTDIQEYKRTQLQEVQYQCDSNGNWTKKFVKSGDHYMPTARRKIKYF